MSTSELVLLCATGVFSSALTAMIGFGGGTFLLGVILLFLPPSAAIPFHGTIQFISNGWRIFLFRRHISWSLVWRFTILLPMGVTLGLWFFQGLSKEVLQMVIGVFVLFSMFARRLKALRDKDLPLAAFFPLGFIVGILNMMVGVVAPLLGVLVVRKELNKESIIGTLGTFAVIGHACKITAFGLTGFSFREFLPALILMTPSVMAGGILGKWLLSRFSEKWFLLIFQGLLGALALKLILWEGLWPYLQ